MPGSQKVDQGFSFTHDMWISWASGSVILVDHIHSPIPAGVPPFFNWRKHLTYNFIIAYECQKENSPGISKYISFIQTEQLEQFWPMKQNFLIPGVFKGWKETSLLLVPSHYSDWNQDVQRKSWASHFLCFSLWRPRLHQEKLLYYLLIQN